MFDITVVCFCVEQKLLTAVVVGAITSHGKALKSDFKPRMFHSVIAVVLALVGVVVVAVSGGSVHRNVPQNNSISIAWVLCNDTVGCIDIPIGPAPGYAVANSMFSRSCQ